METDFALVHLLMDAGVGVREARLLTGLIDHLCSSGEGSDGLAGALLRWRRRAAVDAYKRGLFDASDAKDSTQGASFLSPVSDDVNEWLAWLDGEIGKRKEGRNMDA